MIVLSPVPSLPPTVSDADGTVNDLLITAMIIAIGRWNAAHGRRRRRIRVTMPVSARPASGPPLSAWPGAVHVSAGPPGAAHVSLGPPAGDSAIGNLSRLAAVTAYAADSRWGQGGPRDLDHLDDLVTEVIRQTGHAKEHSGPQVDPLSAALTFLWCPAAVKRHLLRLALRTLGPLICDTSLISNLGRIADPPRFGAAVATNMWFSTPAHMPRGLSLGAVTAAGQLHLCFRYRRALFDEMAAAQFAQVFAAALVDLSATGGPA